MLHSFAARCPVIRSWLDSARERPGEAAILCFAVLLPFYRLGMGEIQPWDESLDVIRAEACLHFDAWLDQTKYAVGHFYSSSHPPLGVWLIAVSRWMFGDSTFASRLPVALASSVSIILVYQLTRRLVSPRAALIGAVSLASSDLFLIYSRRAQLEAFTIAFGVGAVFVFLLAVDSKKLSLALLAGLILGLGLLSKLAAPLFIAPILILLPWVRGRIEARWYPALSIAIALGLNATWLLLMINQHPDYFAHVVESFGILQSGKYQPSGLAWWYYVNQLIVAVPLVVLGVAYVIGPRGEKAERLAIALAVWLLATMAVLVTIQTQKPHFAVLFLLPASMFAGVAWEHTDRMPSMTRFFCAMFGVLAVIWSGSEQVRQLIKGKFDTAHYLMPSVPIGMAILICAGVLLIIWFIARTSTHRYAAFASLALLAGAWLHIASQQPSVYANGAQQGAVILDSLHRNHLDVLHADFPTERYAPQLAYYTHGWTLGWLPNKTADTVTWEAACDPSFQPDPTKDVVVIVRFRDRFAVPTLLETNTLRALDLKLSRLFPHKSLTRSYTLYY